MSIQLFTKVQFYFEPLPEKKIGTMRIDFDNRYDGPLCNKWFPVNNLATIDLKEVQKIVNVIQFEMFNTFDKIVKYCWGTGYDLETCRYFEHGGCNYIVKFIPVVGDYNMYVFVYSGD